MSNKPSLRQRFLDLQEGESMLVSLDEYAMTTVRNYASDLAFASGRTFTCNRDHATRSYKVTRLA